jgi:hypothetical protein
MSTIVIMSALSFLVSSHVKVTSELLQNLIGRDELTITETPNDDDVIGSMTVDIQKSTYKGQECLYVHQVLF